MDDKNNPIVKPIDGCGLFLLNGSDPRTAIASWILKISALIVYHLNDPLIDNKAFVETPCLASILTGLCVLITIVAYDGPRKYIRQNFVTRQFRRIFDFYLNITVIVILTNLIWRQTKNVCKLWVNTVYAVLLRVYNWTGVSFLPLIMNTIISADFIDYFTTSVISVYLMYLLDAVRFTLNLKVMGLLVSWYIEGTLRTLFGCGKMEGRPPWFPVNAPQNEEGDDEEDEEGKEETDEEGKTLRTEKCPFTDPHYDGLRLMWTGLLLHTKNLRAVEEKMKAQRRNSNVRSKSSSGREESQPRIEPSYDDQPFYIS